MPETRSVTDIDRYVSWRLKAARVGSKHSQEDAAELLGVSFKQIQKYESGRNRVTAGKMAMLAEFYGVSIEWLFDGAPVGKAKPSRDLGAEFISMPHGSDVAKSFIAIKSRDDLAMVARFAQALARM